MGISALFLKDTLQVAANDAEMMVEQAMATKASYLEKLEEVFFYADKSHDGMLSFEELSGILALPKVHAYFKVLEMDVHEIVTLFNLLDNGDGYISYDEFIEGIVRLKGQARTMDVIVIKQECKAILKVCQEARDHIAKFSTSGRCK